MVVNPYASPCLPPADELDSRLSAVPSYRPLRVLARWTLICAISAAPSFFWGCGLHHGGEHIGAMLSGIAVFVLAYTAAEGTSSYRLLVLQPYVRRTLLIGYGTRLALSILFPLGLALDMFVGIISLSIVNAVHIEELSLVGQESGGPAFLAVFLTTIVQGGLLNALLFVYMLCLYAIQWFCWPPLKGSGVRS